MRARHSEPRLATRCQENASVPELRFALPRLVAALTRQLGCVLDRAAQTWMEVRLGAELRAVRVHDEPPVTHAALELLASAIAAGLHLALAPAGEQNFAHELAHASNHRPGAGWETGAVLRYNLVPPNVTARYAMVLVVADAGESATAEERMVNVFRVE